MSLNRNDGTLCSSVPELEKNDSCFQIFATNIIDSVSMFPVCLSACPYVCSMYVSLSCYAFRRVLRYGAETWHGGRGWALQVI